MCYTELYFKRINFFSKEVVHQLEMAASYTTSDRCHNGSYALIGGATLTLEYDYGYSNHDVRMALSTVIIH